jgi:hypothetical protein
LTLSEVADRLYALTPADFTRARDQEARKADSEVGAAIRRLRKPTTSAWLVNSLVRHHGADVDQLLALGSALREAQEALDGDELRTLSRRRRHVVGELAALASRDDQVSDSVTREISATLEAALVDERAAAAVRSGRLIKALTSSGFDAVDVDGAVALADQLPKVARVKLHAVASTPHTDRAAKTPAQKSVDEATEQAAVTERDLVKAQAGLDTTNSEVEHTRTRVTQAEDELEQARAALARAEKARTEAKRGRDAAKRARDAAQQALRKAEATAQKRASR